MKLMTLEEFQKQQAQDGGFLGGPSPVDTAPVEDESEGSILRTAWEGLKARDRAALAAGVQDDALRFNATGRAREQMKAHQAEQAKLGTAGQFAAGMLSAAPDIALGMINPLLGGASATISGREHALLSQLEQGRELDAGKATMAGVASGAFDAMTGGLANRARAALPVASPMANLGMRAGIAATEDASSNAAAQVFENLASGRDWSEHTGTAAAFGVAGGATIRGSMAGLNKAMQLPLNNSGRRALEETNELRVDNNLSADEGFTTNAWEFRNADEGLFTTLRNSSTEEEMSKASAALVNQGMKNSGESAALSALNALKRGNVPVTAAAFNVDVPRGMDVNSERFNLGEAFGMSEKEMRKAGEAAERASAGFFGREKAKKAGETKEDYYAQLQESYDRTVNDAYGIFRDNAKILNNELDFIAKQLGSDSEFALDAKILRRDISSLAADVRGATGARADNITDSVEIASRNVYTLASKWGFLDKLKGMDGHFNPINDIMAIRTMDGMFKKMYPAIEHGAPNVNRATGEGFAGKAGTYARDAMAFAAGGPLGVLARRAISGTAGEIGAKVSQRRLRKEKAKGQKRLEDITNSALASAPRRRPEAMAAAAKQAAENLEMEGFNARNIADEIKTDTPPVDTTPVDTTPVETAAPEAPKTTVTKQPGKMVPKTEKAVTPEPEAKPAPGTKSKGLSKRVVKKVAEPEPTKTEEVQVEPAKTEEPASETVKPTEKMTDVRRPKESARKRKRRLQKERQEAAKAAAAKQAEEVKAPTEKLVDVKRPEPAAPKEVEQTKVEEAKVEESVEAPESVSETSKAKAEPLPTSTPKTPEKPVEAAPEAPKKAAPDEKLTRAPTRPEPEAEPVKTEEAEAKKVDEGVEEKVPEQDPVAQEMKRDNISASELVNRPLKEMVAKGTRPAGELTTVDAVNLRKARRLIEQHNTLSHDLAASWNESPDFVSKMIADLGGMEALAQRSKDEGITMKAILQGTRREREAVAAEVAAQKRAELREILREQKEEARAANRVHNTDPEVDADKIRTRHDTVREGLRADGLDEKTIDRAFEAAGVTDAENVKPSIIVKYAKRFAREDRPIPEAPTKASASKKEAPKKPTIEESVDTINDYLDAHKVDKHQEIQDIIDNATRGRTTALNEGQMNTVLNKIMALVKRDRDAYAARLKGVDSKGRPLPAESETDKAYARKMVGKMDTMLADLESDRARITKQLAEEQKAQSKLEEEIAADEARTEAEFAKAAKDHAARVKEMEAEQARIDAELDKRAQVMEQQAELETAMIEGGASDEVVRRVMEDAYRYKDGMLTGSQFNSARDKAIRQTQKAQQEVKKTVVSKVEKQASEMTPEQLITYANESVEMLPDMPPVAFVGAMEAILKRFAEQMEKSPKKKGENPEQKKVKYLKHFAEMVNTAEERSAKYPRNPELWLSYDSKRQLQTLMGGVESTYMGPFQLALKARFTGGTKDSTLMTMSEEAIQKKIKTIEKDRERRRKKRADAAVLGEFVEDMKIN